MTTTPDELLAEEHRQRYGYLETVTCKCGEPPWRVKFRDGEPVNDGQMVCFGCGLLGVVDE